MVPWLKMIAEGTSKQTDRHYKCTAQTSLDSRADNARVLQFSELLNQQHARNGVGRDYTRVMRIAHSLS